MFKHQLSEILEKPSKIITLDLAPDFAYVTIDASRTDIPQTLPPPRPTGKFGFSRLRKALSTINFKERRGSRALPISPAATAASLLQPARVPRRHQHYAGVEIEAPACTDELIPHLHPGLFSLRMIFYSTSPSLFQSHFGPTSSLSGAAARAICP
jgi:hypothetical protein